MMKAEYPKERSFPQRNSAEHERYAGAHSVGNREGVEQDGADLLERILDRNNLNRAYKRVRANKGAPGIDGMTVKDALPWLREHREELLESIRQGKYKPQPVRRKEIPKPDGGVRKLGIPTVIDRIIQQAISQQLVPICEPLFSDDSYGYRPNRSAQQAIQKVKQYAEQGYTSAVLVDLSKYFDTLNHELLMNLLRKNIHDKRVIDWNQLLCDCLLDNTVYDRWDTQLSYTAIRLWNFLSAHRLRLILSLSDAVQKFLPVLSQPG